MDRNTAEVLRNGFRMRILQAAGEPVTAKDLAHHLDVPITRVYHHIRRMEAVGLLGVVGERKRGSAVAKVYQATTDRYSVEGELDDVPAMLTDALKDARQSSPQDIRLASRVIGQIDRAGAEALVEALNALADRMDGNDGDLMSLTYVLAPLHGEDSGSITISDDVPDPLSVVQQVLFEAATWDVQDRSVLPPLEVAMSHPELSIYHDRWGRSGDLLVVGLSGGALVGGAFCRLFDDNEHGHGYLDSQTPELAIAVWPGYRGQGVGTRLLAALEANAATAGLTRLALSVDAGNPAQRLYERAGYETVREDASGLIMVKSIAR